MDAIWKNIIGWDWQRRQATEEPGIYGIPIAAVHTTEEQAHKQLHGHCLVWIKGASDLLQMLQSPSKRQVSYAQHKIIDIFDRTASTKLLQKKDFGNDIFVHQGKCLQIKGTSRPKPSVISAQALRDMRHKTGKNEHKGIIAKCRNCNQEYTLEEILIHYLNQYDSKETNVESWSTVSHSTSTNIVSGKKKMEELLFLLSFPGRKRDPQLSATVTNAVQNIHGDKHAPQCFKKGNECRYRLPTLPSLHTSIEVLEQFDHWYDYLGNRHTYQQRDLLPARSEYDIFGNQYCKAISLSKLGSNSNSQICINGQKAMYCTKYPTKSTQKEDESEYEKVLFYTSCHLAEKIRIEFFRGTLTNNWCKFCTQLQQCYQCLAC